MELCSHGQLLCKGYLDVNDPAILAMLDDTLGFFDIAASDITDGHCQARGIRFAIMLVDRQLSHRFLSCERSRRLALQRYSPAFQLLLP